MKKIVSFFILIIIAGTIQIQAQDQTQSNYYQNIENYKELNLTSDQIKKIRDIKEKNAPLFAEIGRNSNLSGYEKGVKKRELAQQQNAQIEKIITSEQKSKWKDLYNSKNNRRNKNRVKNSSNNHKHHEHHNNHSHD